MIARWLGVYLLMIAALTLFPFVPPACGSSGWTATLLYDDFTLNVLMFVPAGVAIYRLSLARTAAFALALSLAIEIVQQWLPRNPDVTDLVSNTAGALLGRWIAHTWTANARGPMMSRRLERRLVRAAAVLLVGAALVEAVVNPPSDFSNWEPFPLLLANDSVGDHGWVGEIRSLALYDRALGPPDPGATPRPEPTPILRLELDRRDAREARIRLAGPDGVASAAVELPHAPGVVATDGGLSFVPTRLVLPEVARDHVLERLRATSALTLDVALRPFGLHQRGYAHIVSFGAVDGANLLLGQDRSALVARVSTPGTDRDDMVRELSTPEDTLTGELQQVRFTYDGHDGVLYVDGECVDELKLSIATSLPLLSATLGGTLVLCCALASLAVASFSDRRASRLALGAAGGAAAWLALYAFGAWDHVEAFDASALALGALSIVATAPMLLADRLTPAGGDGQRAPSPSRAGASTGDTRTV